MMSRPLAVISLLGVLLASPAGRALADDLKAYGDELQKKFPCVVFIATADLAQALANSAPLLIDARNLKEFEVSRLPGAVLAGKPVKDWLEGQHLKKDRSLVVYCSVGYRSAILARELQKAGFSNVSNLKGSLLGRVKSDLLKMLMAPPTASIPSMPNGCDIYIKPNGNGRLRV